MGATQGHDAAMKKPIRITGADRALGPIGSRYPLSKRWALMAFCRALFLALARGLHRSEVEDLKIHAREVKGLGKEVIAWIQAPIRLTRERVEGMVRLIEEFKSMNKGADLHDRGQVLSW